MSEPVVVPDEPPPRVRGYELLEPISSGAMGVVYKARQLSMDRLVAVMLLPSEVARDPARVERFFHEARAAGRLNHPNIAAAIDVGEADGQYYLAMEYLEGEGLAQAMQREGRLPERRALEIAAAITRGLAHAHRQGIIHRDIRPANIAIARDGTPKLLGLGIAAVGPLGGSPGAAEPDTSYYCSPEAARAEQQLDARADVYSLGATLYHLVVGRPPFDGPNTAVILARHLSDPPPVPRVENPGLSQGTSDLILRMMAKRPEERFQDAGELLRALERLLSWRPAPTTPAVQTPRLKRVHQRAPRRPRRRSSAVGIVIVLVIVLGSLGGASWLAYDRYYRPKPGAADQQAELARHVEEARVRFEEARAFQQDNPDSFRTAAVLFRRIRANYPGTLYAAQAESELAAVESRRRQTLKKELEERWKKATALMADHSFQFALEVFRDFPMRLVTLKDRPELVVAINEYKRQVYARALTGWEQTDAEAVRLWSAGQVKKAIDLLTHRKKRQLPVYRKAMEQRLAMIDDYAKQHLAPPPTAHRVDGLPAQPRPKRVFQALSLPDALRVRVLYATTAERLYALMAQRKYEKARGQATDALKDDRLADARADLEADRQVLLASDRVWQRALAAIPRLSGLQTTVGGIEGVIKGLEGDRIRYNSFGAELGLPVTSLKPTEVVFIAEKGATEPTAALVRDAAVFLAGGGQFKEAAKELARLDADSPEQKEATRLVGHVHRSSDEIRALRTFEAWRRQAADGQWKQAAGSLLELDQLGEHPTARQILNSTALWQAWTREAALLPTLFQGAVVLPEPGVVQVVYDFSADEQLRDWEQRSGAWTTRFDALFQDERQAGGWVRHRGRWIDATLRFDAAPITGNMMIGFIATDRAGQDVAFIVQGERYAVGQGPLKNVSEWDKMRALKTGTLKSATPNGRVSVVCSVEREAFRFVINGAQVIEMRVPGFTLAAFGLASDGEGAFANVAVEGSLDLDWLARQMAADEGK